tara:strand:+ start:253 stop:660 length:408 start_codon:yes stop_codon:yes gene_type:complete
MTIKKLTLLILISFLKAYANNPRPFNIDLKTRLVNDKKLIVNVQLTSFSKRPIDYLEGFLQIINTDNEIIKEHRMVILYGYEPALYNDYSTSKSMTFSEINEINKSFKFQLSKMRFLEDKKVYIWVESAGFLRID